jgi:HEAT repeat protein
VTLADARVLARSSGPQAEILLVLEVAPGDDGSAIAESVRSVDAIGPGEPLAASFRRAVESGAGRAAAALALALAEEAKGDAEVIRDLESGDPRLRDLAVRVLADRRNPAAVPALIGRLQDPDAEVANRAVGALALIGDPRAVGPLVELSRRREGPFVVQMVRAVGDIGGAEAEAYLETLAAGHRDPRVVEAAKEALQDARRSGSRRAARGGKP